MKLLLALTATVLCLALAPQPQHQLSTGHSDVTTLPQAVEWLEKHSNTLIRQSARKMKDGTVAFPPQAGAGYEAFWLRDYAYMLEGCPEAFTKDELKAACQLFLRSLRSDGSGVDCVRFDGTPIFQPGYGSMGKNPVADGSLFTIDVAWRTYQQLHDDSFAKDIYSSLVKAMNAVPKNPHNGLVHITADGYDRCPYGFTDSVRKQGDELFCSLLLIQANRQMAEIATVAGRKQESESYQREAKRLIGSVSQTFWDEKLGLFRAATLQCNQPDLWGSAFAVTHEVASKEQSQRIAKYFKDHYSEIIQKGQLRHLPAGMYWDRACPKDTYQNGGYWATPIGWFSETLDLVDPQLADKTLIEMVNDFQKRGITEWVLADHTAVQNYIASATLPLISAKRLLEKRTHGK